LPHSQSRRSSIRGEQKELSDRTGPATGDDTGTGAFGDGQGPNAGDGDDNDELRDFATPVAGGTLATVNIVAGPDEVPELPVITGATPDQLALLTKALNDLIERITSNKG
jgi:hypothetical protein